MTTAGMTGFLGTVSIVLAGVSGWLWKRLRSATRAAKEAEAKMAALRKRIGKYNKCKHFLFKENTIEKTTNCYIQRNYQVISESKYNIFSRFCVFGSRRNEDHPATPSGRYEESTGTPGWTRRPRQVQPHRSLWSPLPNSRIGRLGVGRSEGRWWRR